MRDKDNKIQFAIKLLQNLPIEEISSSILAPDGNYEESILIGTQDSYIRMAIKFLMIAQADINANSTSLECYIDDINGRDYLYTNEIKKVFDEFGDVWPVCSYIVKDIDEMLKLKKHYK